MKVDHVTAYRQMASALYCWNTRHNEWAQPNRVVELVGPKGSRKTAFILDFFQEKQHFYFSFEGLEERMAQRLLGEQLAKELSCSVPQSWEETFSLLDKLAEKTKIILFDQLDSLAADRVFCMALQKYMEDPNRRRFFLVLIHTDMIPLNLLHLNSHPIIMPYCTVAEIKKACPKRTGQEVLEIYTLSGGIPEIVNSFDRESSIETNMARLLSEKSSFLIFAEEVLTNHFRRPESYAMLLHGIAIGHACVSGLGKFSGFPYNKCDKYLKAMIQAELVQAVKQKNGSGTEKTAYQICNSYFKIWFQYIYPNRTMMAKGSFPDYFLTSALPEIRRTDVELEYISACFRTLQRRMDYQIPMNLRQSVAYHPYTVRENNFSYTFDFAGKEKEIAVFVKIFHDEHSTVGKAQLDELVWAVNLIHPYADSRVYLFSKRRFSDALVKEASFGTVKLFTVNRIRF